MKRALAVVMALSCGGEVRDGTAVELGASLAANPRVTRSQYNPFSCLTCHAVRPGGDRILPGAPFQGAARRPSFWGGEVIHLREAVERCWVNFMRGDATDLDGRDGRALAAWLESLAPEGSTEGTAPVPRTWTTTVRDLGEGDPVRGRALWQRACAYCHGALDTAAGRIAPLVSRLPQDTLAEHCDDDISVAGYTSRPAYIRAIVAEKTRHGNFLGYAGAMPPFAVEVLPDDDLRHIASLFVCP
jgi:mono/diheme cytochrome c family protein